MKNKLTGWKSIFQFTFVQNMKSKSIKITTLIICLIAMLVLPIVTLINGEDKSTKDSTSIKKVYIVDNSTFNLAENLSELKSDTCYEPEEVKLYTGIEYIDRTEEVMKRASEYVMNEEELDFEKVYTFDKGDTGIYMEISYADENIDVCLIYSKDTEVFSTDIEDYETFVENQFEKVLLNNENISEDARKIVHSCQEVEIYEEPEAEDEEVVDEEGEGTYLGEEASDVKVKKDRGDAYALVYGIAMVILFMLAFGGERIAMSIIVEKSSKIMEYLMTSVKPMAVVVGKVLASLLTLVIQFGAIFASLGVSVVITGFIHSDGTFQMPSIVSKLLKSGSLQGVSPANVILAVLIIIAGFLLYGMLAALAGAAVSKMEEVSEGVKIYSFVMIIGAYLSIFVISSRGYVDDSFVKYLACLLPISAPFIAPGTLISSYLSAVYGLLSLGILVIAVVLLTMFVSNVYESMIYYSGTPLKIKDIINISRQNRQKKMEDKNIDGKEEK